MYECFSSLGCDLNIHIHNTGTNSSSSKTVFYFGNTQKRFIGFTFTNIFNLTSGDYINFSLSTGSLRGTNYANFSIYQIA